MPRALLILNGARDRAKATELASTSSYLWHVVGMCWGVNETLVALILLER